MPVNLKSYPGSGWHQPQNKHRAYTNTKLTEDQVREIKREIRQGATNPEIAARYGVNRGTVSNIRTGRSWGNVE